MRNNTLFGMIPVHILIIIFTSIVSVVAFVIMRVYPDSLGIFALQPEAILSGQNLWTLVLHIFIHGNIFHLVMNMFVLFSLGGLTERIIGRKRFFWLYMLSGIFAGALSVAFAGFLGYGFWENVFGSPSIYMVGASGAIFAVAGLLMVLLPNLRFSIIFLPFFSLPAYIMVPVVLFLTWLLSIVAGLPVGNVAHFGGFVAGAAYGWMLRRKYPQKTAMLQRMIR